jgi:hypothetical protein
MKGSHVISHCANPRCGTPFLYFRNGRLFVTPRTNAAVEYFWLCGACAEDLDLEFAERDYPPTVVVRQCGGRGGPQPQFEY